MATSDDVVPLRRDEEAVIRALLPAVAAMMRAFDADLTRAERMTHTGQKVDDALFARLKAHFSEAQIVELTAAVALENFRSKFNPALGVESQGFCLLPGR